MTQAPTTAEGQRVVPAGRPTKYDPRYCERVVALGAEGYSKAMIALELGVVRQTLDNWAYAHPEFLDAMHRAREAALAWWERQGLEGIWNKQFNAAAYRLQMLNRFPDDWSDRHEVEYRGSLANLDLRLLPDHLIERLANGEHPLSVLAGAPAELRTELGLGLLESGKDGG